MYCTKYLGVVKLGQSCTGICQQEIATQDSHLVPKLHVFKWAVRVRPLLQINNPTMHQERRVDQLCDLSQITLTEKREKLK